MTLKLKDYIKDVDDKAERRFSTAGITYKRATQSEDDEGGGIIEGYAAMFNKDSEDFGGYVERIAPGAFSNVLNDNAFALFNHSINRVLGRNGVNLTLSQDDQGLYYTVQLPDTDLAEEIRTLVKQNILNKCSFAFTVGEESWIKPDKEKGTPGVRIINKVDRLYDVSVVTFPAYPDTSVGARSFQKFAEVEEKKEQIRQAVGEQRLKITMWKSKFKF